MSLCGTMDCDCSCDDCQCETDSSKELATSLNDVYVFCEELEQAGFTIEDIQYYV